MRLTHIFLFLLTWAPLLAPEAEARVVSNSSGAALAAEPSVADLLQDTLDQMWRDQKKREAINQAPKKESMVNRACKRVLGWLGYRPETLIDRETPVAEPQLPIDGNEIREFYSGYWDLLKSNEIVARRNEKTKNWEMVMIQVEELYDRDRYDTYLEDSEDRRLPGRETRVRLPKRVIKKEVVLGTFTRSRSTAPHKRTNPLRFVMSDDGVDEFLKRGFSTYHFEEFFERAQRRIYRYYHYYGQR